MVTHRFDGLFLFNNKLLVKKTYINYSLVDSRPNSWDPSSNEHVLSIGK